MDFMVLLTALVAVAREAAPHSFPAVGGIAAFRANFVGHREYRVSGYPVDPSEGEPVLHTSLVSANEVSEAGHGYDIRDSDRFWSNRDGDLKRLVSFGVTPSDYVGELNSCGSVGQARTTPTAEMLDALGVPAFGPYDVTDSRIHWPMFVKERRQNPEGKPGEAYGKALWMANKLMENGEIPVPFHSEFEPMADIQSTVGEAIDGDPWSQAALAHMEESRLLDPSAWESAREALRAERMRRRDGQRERFLKVLGWVQSARPVKVRTAFTWNRDPEKRGAFHKRIAKEKTERAGKDDAFLTSDQVVILTMASMEVTSRRVSPGQSELFQTACDSSPWEAWKATGKGKYEIKWSMTEEVNPFDSNETYIDCEIG